MPSLTPAGPPPQANGRAASPQTCKLHVGHLTRNVNEAHIREIFAAFGPLAGVELAMDKVRRACHRAARAPLAGTPRVPRRAGRRRAGGEPAARLCVR